MFLSMATQNLFFSLSNPIIISILLSLALLGLIYIFYVHIIIPLQKTHKEEKENLELRNARLMALFAELDPEPVFRFDTEGYIMIANKAGRKLLPNPRWEGTKVEEIFKCLQHFEHDKCISFGEIYHYSTRINNGYYDIIVKGVPEMNFGQIYCNDITQRKVIEEELTFSRKKLRDLSNHIQKVQEQEKQKISMELHDNFGQILTSIKLNLELLKEEEARIGLKVEKIKDISELVDHAMSEIKEISYKLKPRILDDFGLVPSLKHLCTEISKKSNIKGFFQAIKFDERLDSEVETGIYRIAQEALNNIVKHSRAKEFSVQLVKHPGFIRLMVEDDGIGFDPERIKEDKHKKNSMGLMNMSERALSFDGKLITDSRVGSGTEIIVEIPLKEKHESN